MHAINGGMLLVKYTIDRLVNKYLNTAKNDEKFDFNIPMGGTLFYIVLCTLCIYAYVVEPEGLNRGLYFKIEELSNI